MHFSHRKIIWHSFHSDRKNPFRVNITTTLFKRETYGGRRSRWGGWSVEYSSTDLFHLSGRAALRTMQSPRVHPREFDARLLQPAANLIYSGKLTFSSECMHTDVRDTTSRSRVQTRRVFRGNEENSRATGRCSRLGFKCIRFIVATPFFFFVVYRYEPEGRRFGKACAPDPLEPWKHVNHLHICTIV